MNLRINLEGQQENAINKRLSEIGNITDEEALAYCILITTSLCSL